MWIESGSMDKKSFLQLYWRNYIAIEKEFTKTLEYVTLDAGNYDTFSGAFIKLLLQTGSEIDISAKILCKYYNAHTIVKDINDYRNEIMKSEKDFSETKVNILHDCNIASFKPWESWNNSKNPIWWTVYNRVKHNRAEKGKVEKIEKDYYKFANLKNTLFALGGLYQALIYIYHYFVASSDKVRVPIPGSHLFELSGHKWDQVTFYQDMAFYMEDGYLFYQTGIY